MFYVNSGRVLVGVALAMSLISCTAGSSPPAPVSTQAPGTSISSEAAETPVAPDLPTMVSSQSHLYELHVPPGWMAKMAAQPQDPDAISGPEGAITVRLHAIPAGIGVSDWIDSYLDAHAADFPSGCLSGGGAPQEHIGIGDDGRLLQLDCLPGWMLVVAHDDRLYDLRFEVPGGATPAAKALFMAMIQGWVFLPGTMPSLGP